MSNRPNILYLHTHDTGRYVQPYGFNISTPNIQKFAEQGILFRKAFSAAPTCSPSRASLLTGQAPHCCGMHGLANPPWLYALHDLSQLLSITLRDAGYETVLGGVQHVTRNTVEAVRSQGFQRLLNPDDIGEDVPDLHFRASDFINKANPLQPWFLALGFDQTHRDNRQGEPDTGTRFSKPDPYDPSTLDSRYIMPPPIFPDTVTTRADMASLAEGAARLDRRIGTVLEALETSGQAENTLVFLTTDHGIAWPGMKCNLTDHGIGIMLIMRGPGGFSGGRVIDSMVSHLDLYPTLMDLLELHHPEWLQGKSLCPLINGSVAEVRKEVFSEQGWHEVAEAQRAIRTKYFKYIRRLDPTGPKAKNCDEGPTKLLMMEHGGFERPLGTELLFDLTLDPQETCNRIHDPQLSSIANDLRERLDHWMQETNDPFLQGQAVPHPGPGKPDPSNP